MSDRLNVLSGARKETKDSVIRVLTQKWPLSAKAIFVSVRGNVSSTTTYQNVHKVLKLLLSQGVVQESNRQYSLDPEWIKGIKSFADSATKKYQHLEEIDFGDIENNSSKSFEFDSYAEPFYALLSEMETHRRTGAADVAVGHARHAWMCMCISKSQYDQFKAVMPRGRNYLLVNSNTVVDGMLSAFWEKFNTRVKLGVPCAHHSDLLVVGDKIIQLYFPTALKKFMDTTFSVSSLRPETMLNVYAAAFEPFGKTRIVITRNAALANQICAETLEYFK